VAAEAYFLAGRLWIAAV